MGGTVNAAVSVVALEPESPAGPPPVTRLAMGATVPAARLPGESSLRSVNVFATVSAASTLNQPAPCTYAHCPIANPPASCTLATVEPPTIGTVNAVVSGVAAGLDGPGGPPP